jgi:hypothetical protein
MKKRVYLNQNYYDYAEMHAWDPYVVNRHVSKGWEPSAYDFQDNDDLFYNNWSGEHEDDFQHPDLALGDAYFEVEGYDDDGDDIDDEVTEEPRGEAPGSDKVILLENHQNKRDFYMALSKVFARGGDKSSFLKHLYLDTCQVCGHQMELSITFNPEPKAAQMSLKTC